MALVGLFAAVAATCVGFIAWLNCGVERLADFSALWETHDVLLDHVRTTGTWPRDWRDLEPSFQAVDAAGYGNRELDHLRERVMVNFGTDAIGDFSREARWLLRLKSGRLPDEEKEANRRLKESIRNFIQQEVKASGNSGRG